MILNPEIIRDIHGLEREDRGITIQGSSLYSHYELYRTFRNILNSTAYAFRYAIIDESHSTSKYSHILPDDDTIMLEIGINKLSNCRKYGFVADLYPVRDIDHKILERDRIFLLGMFRKCGGLTITAACP